jgi:hypothetical protein
VEASSELKIILPQTRLYLKIVGFRGGSALSRICFKEVGIVYRLCCRRFGYPCYIHFSRISVDPIPIEVVMMTVKNGSILGYTAETIASVFSAVTRYQTTRQQIHEASTAQGYATVHQLQATDLVQPVRY